MAEQDFNINIRTLADLTGIKLTQQQLEALQKAAAEGNQKAIQALKQLTDAQNQAQGNLGLAGSAIGLGTITSLLTGAISKWKEFNAEQDKWVEGMINAAEKARELGDSIVDMQDKARSAARLGVEPLYQSFIRLQQEIIRLKTEQGLLNLPTQGEEWKKLAKDIAIVEGQLKGVTRELQEQSKEADKAAAKKQKDAESFLKNAITSSSEQTQAVLANEDAARRARERGDAQSAAMHQQAAEERKASLTAEQRAEYEALSKPVRLGRTAGPGESQEIIDEMARQQINFQRQLKGEAPLPGRGEMSNQDLIDAINQLRNELVGIWR
jgi:hypothetical protein